MNIKESNSIVLAGDSYKFSHWLQYPPKTKAVSSYIESRGFAYPFDTSDMEVVHFGTQMLLDKLSKPVTKEEVEYAAELAKAHGLPFNTQGWMDIVDYRDGFLPVSIQALPEGLPVPLHTPQVQITNTMASAFWLPSYLETALLRATWYPSSVATLSREIKKIIKIFLEKSADTIDSLPFKLHDFGSRGASSEESAGLGGMAHLVNFMGTDTVSALVNARKYYGADMAAFSVSAAEHSTITAWGLDGEEAAYRNMLKQFGKPGAIVSVVSDSYDIYNACEKLWGGSLKQEVIDSGAILVVRPDSGDPVEVTLKVIEILGAQFGYSVNSKGYKVLPSYVRIIQGDGIGKKSIPEILLNYLRNGWSAENITFGMGGALLQQVNRDSLKYAMKANAIDFGRGWESISKKPATDHGKDSKKGRQAVIRENGKFISLTEEQVTPEENFLEEVFRDGKIMKTWNLEEVRNHAAL